MAFLDELKKIVRPIDDDDDYDYIENDEEYDDEDEGFSEEFDDEPEYEEPKPKVKPKAQAQVYAKREVRAPAYQSPADRVGSGKTKMVMKAPETFEDAAAIAEELINRKAVLMNLEHANSDDSRRLIDFLSGVAFALGGKIKRFSARAYILTPTNIDLVGDSVDDFESDGLYF